MLLSVFPLLVRFLPQSLFRSISINIPRRVYYHSLLCTSCRYPHYSRRGSWQDVDDAHTAIVTAAGEAKSAVGEGLRREVEARNGENVGDAVERASKISNQRVRDAGKSAHEALRVKNGAQDVGSANGAVRRRISPFSRPTARTCVL